MAVVVAVGVAGPGGAAARLAAARGAASPAEAVLGLPEGGQQGLELGRGHAGEAPERSGATGQRAKDS